MRFEDVLSLQFTPATKENFPASLCTRETENKRDPGVFYSDKYYLGIVVDKRFKNEMSIYLLSPYVWIGDLGEGRGEETSFAWITPEGNRYFDNMENPIHYDDEYVVAFAPFTSTEEENKEFWTKLFDGIESI